jgi:hypothetical protein
MAGLDLKDLAKRGAAARLAELQAEAAALLKAFPSLKGNIDSGFTRRGAFVANTDDGTTVLPGNRRKRKPMTAAQKRAVGIRMKKYWAERRRESK